MTENDRPTSYNILFVCTGNTCRSPLAEVIARHALEERGWHHVQVDSAGTSAMWDAPASSGSQTVAAEVGLDLSTHRSQPLSRELVERADIILGMTEGHVHAVAQLGGEDKTSLITEFISGPGRGEAVSDPIGGSQADYEEARDRIATAIDALLDRLAAILSP